MQIGILERPRPERSSAPAEALRSGAVSSHPGAGRAVVAAAPRRGPRWAVAGGVLAVLAAAVWSLTAVNGAVSPAGPGEIGLVGGVVHVDSVVSAARAQHAMPGMGADNDPVADDERRISVDVTLRADEHADLRYDPRAFRLAVDGGTASAPHKLVLPGEELPPGTSLSGTLVFDVPKDATAAVLSYREQRTAVALPVEAAAVAPASGTPVTADAHAGGHD